MFVWLMYNNFLNLSGDISAEELFNMFFGGGFNTGKLSLKCAGVLTGYVDSNI